MGVKGLWQLLMPVGRRISIETLEGQILAIDASIWLTQFLTVAAAKRERDLLDEYGGGNNDGSGDRKRNKNNKPIHMIIWLGFYDGVRPVIVFDGATPEIKMREIRERNKRRTRTLGTLITKKNKNKKMKLNDVATEANVSNNVDKTNTGGDGDGGATASFAPGFYDPTAIRIEQQQQKQQQKQQQQDVKNGIANDNGNDWDTAIVIHEDEDDEEEEEEDDDKSTQNSNNSNNNNNSKKRSRRIKSKTKSAASYYDASSYSTTDTFHAGDGTEFEVETVSNLPETRRKDVIEDAMKQRRLASRREFMKVASNPDGLSDCQLRNFLKSTRLNRDIKQMAQQAAIKAEQESAAAAEAANNNEHYNSGGRNKIIFEKDKDGITANNNKSNNQKKSSIH
ncbi:PIN domain-like protein, partial [Fragilariopsis cylindrus CCMP1102]